MYSREMSTPQAKNSTNRPYPVSEDERIQAVQQERDHDEERHVLYPCHLEYLGHIRRISAHTQR